MNNPYPNTLALHNPTKKKKKSLPQNSDREKNNHQNCKIFVMKIMIIRV